MHHLCLRIYFMFISIIILLSDINCFFTFLEKELKKISKDVRLGFGAFVDKPLMPYIGTRLTAIDNPCYPRAECRATYGFDNRLSLTSDTSIFGSQVRGTPISGNQDGPEGGLDALLQAMVCGVSCTGHWGYFYCDCPLFSISYQLLHCQRVTHTLEQWCYSSVTVFVLLLSLFLTFHLLLICSSFFVDSYFHMIFIIPVFSSINFYLQTFVFVYFI